MPTLVRSNLPDLYLADALPFLEAVIEEEHEQFPYVYDKVFNVRNMKHGIAQHSQVSSISPLQEVPEATEIGQDKVYQGYSTTYIAKKYGTLLATSQETIDDEKVESLSKSPRKMGRAAASTVEIQAAAIFNNGFTVNGSDGQPLFSTAHPLLAPGAGVNSNRLAVDADLSVTSLKDLTTLMRKTRDTANNRIMLKPKYLLVPSELEHTAFELLRSIYLPDTPNNNLSSIGPQGAYRIEPMVWDYLTDPDAHFLCTDPTDNELYFFWSKQLEIKSEIEFKTNVALTRCLMRMVAGYSDWRGVVGTPGA